MQFLLFVDSLENNKSILVSLSVILSLLMILFSIYLKRKFFLIIYRKRKFNKLFSLDASLEKEMNNFRSQQTKLIFHFIHLSNKNKTYKELCITSQNKIYDIKGEDLIFDYEDKKYTFKYNVSEKIILYLDDENYRTFFITVNKFCENHYNIIIDKFDNEKTFSLEVVIYSKIKKCLKDINELQKLKKYRKENVFPNMLRFNIINALKTDLIYIYSINMEKEKSQIEQTFFSGLKENLLLNLIYSKDEKIAHRRIFENTEEKEIFILENKEIQLVKDFYTKVLKKYINANIYNSLNAKKLKEEFILFEKAHEYSKVDQNKNGDVNIDFNLRNINDKFKYNQFYIRYYDKIDIPEEDLKITEYLCYLNLLLLKNDYFLDKIQNLNKKKNKIFNRYYYLSNKDKSLILMNLLANEIKAKACYKFRTFYELPLTSPYVQSELFFRKTISQLTDNSSLSFLFLQLNSGSGEDFLTKAQYYKIKIVPLIEIKFHLLKEFFYPYFFTYDSNNNIMALYNCNTQILSFNESDDVGYTMPKNLCETQDESNMIKLSFLKFHEQAHVKFKENYDDRLDPQYFLDENLNLIDNRISSKNSEISLSGESGNALEYYIFNDYFTLDRLMKSKEDLSPLNNVDLLIHDNFNELRNIIQELTKNVKLASFKDKRHELYKKYNDKVNESIDFKNKKLSDIRLRDLDIVEFY